MKPTDVSLVLRTTTDLGQAHLADEFLAVLADVDSAWLPRRIGPSEPLRAKHSNAAFRNLWMALDEDDTSHGSLMYTAGPATRAFGWIEWRRAWNQSFNWVLLSVPHAIFRERHAQLVRIGIRLSKVLRAEHACIRSSAEHDSQHRPTGVGPVQGIDLSRHVPGVYYLNLFGRTLVEFIGGSKFESCPAVLSERTDCGWLLTTADDPGDWASEAALKAKAAIRHHLGERLFFDLKAPGRATIAPFYDFREVRIGARPERVHAKSVGEEFFAGPDDARAFANQVLELSGRLRSRASDPGTLDYSPDSLARADELVSRLVSRPDFDRKSLTLDVAAYYGEVVRRRLGGSWGISDRDPLAPVVRCSGGAEESPFVRAVKLLQGEDRLADWFAFVEAGGESLLRRGR